MRGVVLTVVCALLLGVPALATASTDGGTTVDASTYGLEVTVGHGGFVSASSWTPVEVRVAPARPVAGLLHVDSRTWDGTVERRELEIEVAGGATNVYRLVVPRGDIQVSLREGDVGATVQQDLAVGPSTRWLVGHLGSVPARAPNLHSPVTGRSGAWVDLHPDWVSVPAGLSTLDAVVTDRETLAALDEAATTSLDAAVAAGLQLVVTDTEPDTDGPVWAVQQDGRTVASARDVGKGRVVTTAATVDDADRELWTQLVGPREGMSTHDEWDVRRNPWQFGRMMSGGDDAVPTVPWFAGFLAAYILAVGPLNWLLLRRIGRHELAWATVPAVTVLFTGTVAVASVGTNPVVGTAGRAVWTIDGVGEEHVAVAVRAPSAGTRTATLPGDGWAATPISDGGMRGRSSALVRPVLGGTQVEVDLASLEFGGLVASRPIRTTPPLTVSATVDHTTVAVTVTNTGTAELHDAMVRVGSAHRHLGTLAPGEDRLVEVPGGSLFRTDPWMDPFNDLEDTGDTVELPITLEPLLRTAVLDGDPGLVWALATSPAGSGDIDVDGDRAVDEGTLFAVGTHPVLPDGAVGPYAVARELVSDAGEYRPGPQSVETPEAVLRYRFPAAGRLGPLEADLHGGNEFGQATLEVWDVLEERWVPLADAFPDRSGDPDRFVSPFGELYVRASGEMWPFEFSSRTVFVAPDAGGTT